MTPRIRHHWDQLTLYLHQTLAIEDYRNLLPVLIGINSLIETDEIEDHITRSLNFMVYEISAATSGLKEADRWLLLNDYFFSRKNFQAICIPSQPQPMLKLNPLLLSQVINQRVGHPMVLSIIYSHFAQLIDLPIFLVHCPPQFLLKWIRSGHNHYIDLNQKGRVINENELTHFLNIQGIQWTQDEYDTFEILPLRQIITQYLKMIIEYFENFQDPQKLLLLYNLLVQMDSQNVKILAKRSLLYRELGLLQEAVTDLKRYFSFVEKDHSSPELRSVFIELQKQIESQVQNSLKDLYH